MVLSVEPVFHLTERRYWYPARLNRVGGIGKNVKEGQTPSMTDGQFYLLNIADKRVTPLTKILIPAYSVPCGIRPTGKYISRPRTVTVTVCTG